MVVNGKRYLFYHTNIRWVVVFLPLPKCVHISSCLSPLGVVRVMTLCFGGVSASVHPLINAATLQQQHARPSASQSLCNTIGLEVKIRGGQP